MKQWPAGVNYRFAEATENDILRTQDITTANDTKKATKLGMKVFRDKQCFNTQFAHMSSVFSPDRQALLMLLSLNNNCPSTAPFQSLLQVNSTSIEQNVSIHENLNVTVSLQNDCDFQHSNSKLMYVMSDFSGGNWHKLFFQFLFQVNCNCLHGTTLRF